MVICKAPLTGGYSEALSARDVPDTNFLPGTEYWVLRRFFTGSGY